ncbi:peptidase M20 family protein [Sphingomonas changbaiensis NBRC 104936]|uniref:Peptidase M20 family protein n=1 Tax=Sphingomonas changbaiensis NBRC 104936 TaxID=1219043 RepID=A0A0E9MQJ2_9SPHN|nr:hydrolase [Sphingomonas changbaiensis]GAO39711.1 peptidase M20 family protein [Sphingomonas changbaiensis NBRC 104936]
MGLSGIEQRACEAAAAVPMLDQVQAWAAVNSGSRNLPGLTTMAGLLADAFSALPGKLELVPPDPVEIVDPNGSVRAVQHGAHLLLTMRPDAPVQLLFTGHYDTVFGADHPFQSLKSLDDGRLNGPGVADMKGGLSLMLAALKAVETTPAAPSFGYQVLIDSDEEVGSPSSAALIARAAQGKAAAFTYEPALPDGTLAGARGGSGNFSIVVSGRSAHAGRNPEEGRNALLAAADLALRLEQAIGPGLKANPAKIDGGGPNNVVPDHAVLRVNFRPASPDDETRARAHLDQAVAQVAAARDVRIHVHGGFGRPPKPLDPAAERLFGLVKSCGADLGLNIGWKATGGVCDGNNIAACGVPVVDTMGARGGAIHSEEEFLIPESLPERAMLSTLAILRLADRGRP